MKDKLLKEAAELIGDICHVDCDGYHEAAHKWTKDYENFAVTSTNKQSKLGSLGLKPNCRFDGSVAVPKSRRRHVANAATSCICQTL